MGLSLRVEMPVLCISYREVCYFRFSVNKMHKLIYLYILKCNDGTYYTGVTNNLEKRVEEHNRGINKESYIYYRKPVKLVWCEMFNDFHLAFDW